MSDELTALVFEALRGIAVSIERLDERMKRLEARIQQWDDVQVARFHTGFRYKDAARIFGCTYSQFHSLVDRGWIKTFPLEPGSTTRVVTLAGILEARRAILQEDWESRLHPWHQKKIQLPPGMEQLMEIREAFDTKVARVTAVRNALKEKNEPKTSPDQVQLVADARRFMREQRSKRTRGKQGGYSEGEAGQSRAGDDDSVR